MSSFRVGSSATAKRRALLFAGLSDCTAGYLDIPLHSQRLTLIPCEFQRYSHRM